MTASARPVGKLASDFHVLATDRILDGKKFFLDLYLLVLGMQLNAGFVTHSILDNAQETLVRALPDSDSLADELVSPHASRRAHRRSRLTLTLRCRSQFGKIWSRCLSTSTLCCHGDDIVSTNDKEASVLYELSVLDVKDASVDVDDISLTVFAAMLLDSVIHSNLGSISVCSNGISISANHIRNLCMQDCSDL